MSAKLTQWLKSGAYLPDFMRDFHDQKDVFKAMHEIIKPANDNDIMEKVSWVDGHIYTVDIFLWFMARRGYTLQRSRAKQAFLDIKKTLAEQNAKRSEAVAAMLREHSQAMQADPDSPSAIAVAETLAAKDALKGGV
jgi:hypothetical protein